MAGLFEKRMNCSAQIAAYKRTKGLPVKDAAREEELIRKNLSYIKDEEIREFYIEFIRKVIELSCQRQIILNKGKVAANAEENHDKDSLLNK